MSTESPSKLNRILRAQPAGVVLCSAWLADNGYSNDLQKRYENSLWFESVGTGDVAKFQITVPKALEAINAALLRKNNTTYSVPYR